jgi:hypothetical protein
MFPSMALTTRPICIAYNDLVSYSTGNLDGARNMLVQHEQLRVRTRSWFAQERMI